LGPGKSIETTDVFDFRASLRLIAISQTLWLDWV